MRPSWLAWLAALLVVPAVAAGPTTLMWHGVDGHDDGVLSTQSVPAGLSFLDRVPSSLAGGPCGGIPGILDATQVQAWRGLTSVSGAWYQDDDDGNLELFGSPGVPGALPAARVKAHVFLATVASTGEGNLVDVPALPGVVVRATLARVPIEDPEAEPLLLAEAETAPAVLAADGTQGAIHHMDGERHVYEFVLELDMAPSPRNAPDEFGRDWPLAFGIDARMAVECPAQGRLEVPALALVSAPGLRTRLALETVQPLSSEYLHPQFVGDDLVLHSTVNSLWGKYDLGPATATLTGPDGATEPVPLLPVRQPAHAHSPSDPRLGAGPVDVTFVMPFVDRAPGNYTATVTFTDLSGNATLQSYAMFQVAPAKESPGPNLALALVVLGGLAAAWRRR